MIGTGSIRTLIVEDQGMIRGALWTFLQLDNDIEIVGEAVNGVEAVQLARRYDPDLVVLDIGLPDMDGLEVARRIHEIKPTMRIVCLAPEDDAAKIAAVAQYGLPVLFTRSTTSTQLLDAIRRAMSDIPRFQPVQHDDSAPAALTRREQEVAQLLATGLTNREIAAQLKIAIPTAKLYIQHIMRKRAVVSRV